MLSLGLLAGVFGSGAAYDFVHAGGDVGAAALVGVGQREHVGEEGGHLLGLFSAPLFYVADQCAAVAATDLRCTETLLHQV